MISKVFSTDLTSFTGQVGKSVNEYSNPVRVVCRVNLGALVYHILHWQIPLKILT